jgi:hypothetical protein
MDDSTTLDKHFNPWVRTVQIIHGSLMAGVLFFAGIVLYQNAAEARAKPDQPPVISYAAVVMFAAAVVLWALLPGKIADSQVSKIAAGKWTGGASRSGQPAPSTDLGKLLAVYQTKCIIAGALLEAPAFLAGAAYMSERQPFVMGVIAGFIILMGISFPTRGRVLDWVQTRLDRIEQEREFGGLGTD